ncbi:TetR family transcriptional regulator [Pseudogracilibacillus auburnensis]|uniref:TetR family transcriptional regulator n=1 Tax=Pseudogracilibacillus auburnensis TaxID=1494959 RepID=UPI000D76652E
MASGYLHLRRRTLLIISTKDKIIDAAIELVNEKGYKGATTRAIAERAGVNEVTLFRHFGNKKGIVEAAIDKYAFVDLLANTFEQKIIWDLEQDLKMLAKEYQLLVEEKKPLILLSFREAAEFPELDELLSFIPQKFKQILEDYFDQMIQKKKLKKVDPSVIATNFIFINIGYFFMNSRMNSITEKLSIENFVENNIDFFIQALN